MDPLASVASWSASHVAAATIDPHGNVTTTGDIDRVFELASVTKLITALAVLVAVEEGTVGLDEPLMADGATTADLLAHASGMAPDTNRQMAAPRTRRIYSTAAYDVPAEAIAARSLMPFAEYLREAVTIPLAMTSTVLAGSAGAGARSTVRDLLQLAEAWRTPLLIHPTTLQRAVSPHLPDLSGVLPGFGRQNPNEWGLGPEIRGTKHPHWTGSKNSPDTYGHFGQAGTMMWIDPVAGQVVVALSDEPFGPWAVESWPTLADRILGDGPNGPSDSTGV